MMRNLLRANWPGMLLFLSLLIAYLVFASEWSFGTRIIVLIVRAAPEIITYLIPLAVLGSISLIANSNVQACRSRSVGLFSILAGVLMAVVTAALVISLRDDLGAPIFRYLANLMPRYHWAILSIASAVVVLIMFSGVLFKSDLEEFLDGFKTFPLLSPFVCFSAPAAWKDALIKFGVSDGNARALAILVFCAGVLFIFSLVFLWTGKARKKRSASVSGLFGPDGTLLPTSNQSGSGYFALSLACLILGILPTFLAVFELAYAINIHPTVP